MCERCPIPPRNTLSRRGVLAGLSAMLAAAGPPPAATISGEEALRRLMDGNARYLANKTHVRDFAVDRAKRTVTHRPIVSILSCSDARVGPEFIFDQAPGDMFVVRVAGNILRDEGLASLEYAAQFLGSPLILVLGHSSCGAIEAAIQVVKDNATVPGHLPGLVDVLRPAVVAAQATQPANLLNAAITENVRQTVKAVGSAQPMLAGMIASGKVKLAGGTYDIATGRVSLL